MLACSFNSTCCIAHDFRRMLARGEAGSSTCRICKKIRNEALHEHCWYGAIEIMGSLTT